MHWGIAGLITSDFHLMHGVGVGGRCVEEQGVQGLAVCGKICSQSQLLSACHFRPTVPDPTARLCFSQYHCDDNVQKDL